MSLGCALLLALAWAAPAHAAGTPQDMVHVLEGWRFRWGDSPMGPDGVPLWAKSGDAAEGWRPMVALQEPPGRGSQSMLWISIPVPKGDWPEPALFLASVANAFEVYAGGQRLYTSGKLDPAGQEEQGGMARHLVPLPPTVPGDRVLVRIQSSGSLIGVSQDVRVGSRHELLGWMTRTGLAPFVTGCLFLGLALLIAIAAVVRRQHRMLVGLSVFTLGSGLLLLGASGLFSALWDESTTTSRIILLGSYCLLPGLAWFISDTLVEGRMRWFRRGAAVVSVPALLQAILVLVDLGAAQRLMPPFVAYSLPCLIFCFGVAAVEAWRGNADARIFVVGLGILCVLLVISTLPVFGFTESGENFIHWGFLALTLSLVGIVARRSALVVQALAAHTRQLEERRKEVLRLAEGMGSGAGELAAVVQQLRTTTEEQTAGISRQATALQQLEQTVKEIRLGSQVTSEKAQELAASAISAEQVGREGGASLERTLSDLEAIRGEVAEMARRILSLDGHTREILGIVDTVKGLADQSNMLAVNAAIEAARSGEHGRGFGVVSREVRNLADQSILATQRIRDVLDNVSMSMREAAKMSEQGEKRVKVSLDAVRGSGAQLQKLAGFIGDTGSNVRQITAAVTQQDAGTSQIAQAIQELSAQMQATLKVVQETQTVTKSVQLLAESMAVTAQQALHSDTLAAATG